jgi:hypothetical protein
VTAGGGVYLVVGLIVGSLGSQAGDVDAKLGEHVTGGERGESDGKGENQEENDSDLLHFFVPSVFLFLNNLRYYNYIIYM